MLKTLQFGDKDVTFSTSMAWVFRYRSQFGKDAAKVLVPMIKRTQGGEEFTWVFLEELGISGVFELAWCMAAVVDKSIPDPETWVISFGDDFPTMDIITELIPDALQSCFSSKN